MQKKEKPRGARQPGSRERESREELGRSYVLPSPQSPASSDQDPPLRASQLHCCHHLVTFQKPHLSAHEARGEHLDINHNLCFKIIRTFIFYISII